MAALDQGSEEEYQHKVKAEHSAEGHRGGTGVAVVDFISLGVRFPGGYFL